MDRRRTVNPAVLENLLRSECHGGETSSAVVRRREEQSGRKARGALSLCVRRSRSLYNPRSRTATAHQVRSSAHWKKRPGEQVYLKASELCQSRTEIYDGGDLKRVAEAVFSLGLYVFGMYIVMFGLDDQLSHVLSALGRYSGGWGLRAN